MSVSRPVADAGERWHQKSLKHQDLLEWLDNHRFEDLKQLILNTHGVAREIDILLQAQQGEILGELSIISKTVSQIASRMEILGGLSMAVSPNIKLSVQAVEMLQLLNQAEPIYPFMHIRGTSMNANMLSVGTATYTLGESRFVREDIGDLLNAGFIMKHKVTDGGEPVFGITRLGAEYANALKPQESQAG